MVHLLTGFQSLKSHPYFYKLFRQTARQWQWLERIRSTILSQVFHNIYTSLILTFTNIDINHDRRRENGRHE